MMPKSMREYLRVPRPRLLSALAYLVYLPVFVGFLLHTSPEGAWRVFGKYSPQLMRRLQAARPAWRIEAVNAACGAHTTFHSLIKYAVILQDFDPDLVVIMHAVNDADEGVPDFIRTPWSRPFERDYGHPTGLLGDLCVQGGLTRPEAVDFKVSYLTPNDAAFPPWAASRDLYRWSMVQVLRRFNDANREVAGELGVPFVDLEAAVPPRWEDFQREHEDGIHMSAAGCARAAEALLRSILPLIPERPGNEDRGSAVVEGSCLD